MNNRLSFKDSITGRARPLLLTLLLLLTVTGALAERRERVVDTWRPLHYNVALTLDDRLTELTSARAEISVAILRGRLARLELDFGELPVDSVTVAGRPARFEQHAGRLDVQLLRVVTRNERLTVVVTYHGRPKDGLVMTADKAGKPSATGDNWPDRLHNWIPCLDHPSAKATINFSVTAPARETVVANGQLTGTRDNPAGTRTWTYSETRPIPPYCMVISVGEYALSGPVTGAVTPLTYYVPQTDRAYAVQGFGAAAPSLAFFSEKVAPYPYEKLALIVGATRFGGMENSSAIVFGSTLFDPRPGPEPLSPRFNIRRGIVEVTAHEIAHQWFGDSVTEARWSDLWLSEGFATYFAGLFIERYEGAAAFRDYMQRAADRYFEYERGQRTPIYDTSTEDLLKLLNANNYQKGAWVLHMLRSQLGDEPFYRGIRAYYRAHRNATATTGDLRAALEGASGTDLREFFTRWVYGSGHPRYEASWEWREARGRGGALTIRLRQTQDDAPFLTPLPVEFGLAGSTRRALIRPTGKLTVARFPLPSRPAAVRIDPDETVLKELSVTASQ